MLKIWMIQITTLNLNLEKHSIFVLNNAIVIILYFYFPTYCIYALFLKKTVAWNFLLTSFISFIVELGI